MNRSSTWKWLHRACAVAALALAGCSALPVITPDMARVDPASVQFQAANGRILSPERSKELIAKLGGAGQQRRPGAPSRARAGRRRQPARPRQPRRHPRGRPEHLRRDVQRDRRGARQHQHGDLHPRGRRGRPAARRCADRQAAARRPGQPDPRRRRHARHEEGVLPAPERRRHQRARVQPGQPARRQGRLGGQPARPPQAPRRRRPQRGARRHQHQQRLFEQPAGRLGRQHERRLARRRQEEPALARHRPADRRAGRRAAAEALHGDVASPEGQAARAARVLPGPAGARPGGRSRDRQRTRRAVQPDLRDADLGDQQRRKRDPRSPTRTSSPIRS